MENDEENQSPTWVPFDVVSTRRVPNDVLKKEGFGEGRRQFPSEERQEAHKKIKICYDEDLDRSALRYRKQSSRVPAWMMRVTVVQLKRQSLKLQS